MVKMAFGLDRGPTMKDGQLLPEAGILSTERISMQQKPRRPGTTLPTVPFPQPQRKRNVFLRRALILSLYVVLFSLSLQALSQHGKKNTVSDWSTPILPASLHENVESQGSTDGSKIKGLTPTEVRRIYGFDQIENGGAGQKIAIVVAFDHPDIEDDLNLFSTTFDLPTTIDQNSSFKFEKVIIPEDPQNPCAQSSLSVLESWQLESALDVEWAHAIAPEADITLIEASGPCLDALIPAVDTAIIDEEATVVSMSWGVPEVAFHVTTNDDDRTFADRSVAFVAGAGDSGSPPLWPATSPNVTGVGGTKLLLNGKGRYIGEVAWSSSGGGLSAVFDRPYKYQSDSFNTYTMRGTPDVAYNATSGNINNGFAVYSSTSYFGHVGWHSIGGTSAGVPQWAALIAIANSMRSTFLTGQDVNAAVYEAAKDNESYADNFHDIRAGTSNKCGALCSAGPGYDFVTGLGSPQAKNLIQALVNYDN